MGEFRITEQTEAAALAGSEQLPVAQLSSTVFRTGTTISASSVGNVLYDSANGWLAAGLAGNQQVNVSGWTGGSVANNLDSATIVSVTANALYLDTPLTSASAGDTVTVRRWMPRKVSLAGRLKTYFDTLYQAVGTYLTPGAIATSGLTMATAKLLGRTTATTGAVEEITVGAGLSLSAGTLSATGGGITELTGDVTASGSGSVAATIANDAVTYAKMQDISAQYRVLARKSASAGDPEETTLSELLDFIGSAAQGDILYRGASSWARLGAGTSGQYLKTNGAGANPAWASFNFSVGFGFTSTPTASEVLLLYTFAEAVTFPDEWSGSVGDIGTNPTASFVLTVQKNGSSVGTVTISTGGAFTFVTTGTSVAFAVGDQLKVVGPATPDASAANVSITFLGAK